MYELHLVGHCVTGAECQPEAKGLPAQTCLEVMHMSILRFPVAVATYRLYHTILLSHPSSGLQSKANALQQKGHSHCYDRAAAATRPSRQQVI